MKKLPFLLLALASCSQESESVSAAAAADSSSAPATGTAPVLSWDGYGPVQFGMKVEDAERVAGTRIDAERALDPGCDHTGFAALPGMKFMVENGVITRGEAEPGVLNSLDVSVDDSLASVTISHPEAVVAPHKYDPTGNYVLFVAPAGDRAIVLEMQKENVALVRAGLEPAVEYVESCS